MGSQNIDKFLIPLLIGSEITLFIQSRLRHHADYLLYKSLRTYDSSVAARYNVNVIFDHRISKVRRGWYLQDRLLMPTSVMYCVLKEKEVSHASANWSIFCNEFTLHAGLIGSLLITNVVIMFIEEYSEKNVNISKRNTQLGIGIGLEFLAGISSIISGGIRDKAIEKYNETLPKAAKPFQFFDPIPATPVQQE
jgi:hypothetical protein